MKRFFNFAIFVVALTGCMLLSDSFTMHMDLMSRSLDTLSHRH